MTDNWNDLNQSLTRRNALKASTAGLTTLLAGCTTSGEPEPSTDTPTSTTEDHTTQESTTEENTTTEVQDKTFDEIYDETFEDDQHGLLPNQVESYEKRLEEEDYESFSHLLEDLNTTVGDNFAFDNDSQKLTEHWKHAIHNDLGFSSDEVRVLGRDMAGGGTYTAIMHKNEHGDWVKDLALPFQGEGSYLRHDETKEDIDFNDEAERGLWNIWRTTTPTPATHYSNLAENDWEEADDDSVRRVMDWTSKGNDHIVVGEPYEEPTVGYSSVEAAQAVEDIMNWHENDTFNEEMAMVEQATETWHNSEEAYLKMEMQNGELTAVPTEEYTGPEEIYLN